MDQIEKDILEWYNKDRYKRIGNDVSITELQKPVRAVHLQNRHRPRLKRNELGNLVPSLTGSGLHDQFQRYLRDCDRVNGTWMIERRLLSVIDGVRVAGRFDALYNQERLYDIKVTRAWKFIKGDYTEWEEQLNAYDWMLWKDGISINSLHIMGIVLDWQQGKLYKPGYPKSRIQIIKMNRWSRQQQETWLKQRVGIWKQGLSLSDTQLPLCTPQERWAAWPVYKLYRTKSAQRATKNFTTRQRATAYLAACQKADKQKWSGAKITKYIDPNTAWKRCDDWCEVAPFCNQYKNKIEV